MPQRKRPRPSKRRSRSSPLFLLTFAVPLLALLGFWLYQHRDKFHLRTTPDKTSAAPKTPSLADALVKSGIERARLKPVAEGFVVETLLDSESLARELKRRLPGARITSSPGQIRVATEDAESVVRLRKLRITDSGAGLVDTEEGETPAHATNPASWPRHKTIALILDDVGFDRQPLEEAAALGGAITFAIIPRTPNAERSARLLHARGSQILCHLPMEPDDYPRQNPGEGAILTSMSDDEIRRVAGAGLASIPFARGVNNHMGSRATSDRRVMRDVLEVIRARGVFYVDSRTSPASLGAAIARELHVKTVSRNVFLDDVEEAGEIKRQIRALATLADKNGSAVGIGHIYPVTVAVLRSEIPRLERAGYHFVAVSELVE